MEAVGFEARVALRRKADEEVLSILHFRRRPGSCGEQAPASGGGRAPRAAATTAAAAAAVAADACCAAP